MMIRYLIFAAVICVAGMVHLGDGYRILCVFPTQSFSHQVVFRGLTLALNERGHELVVITPNPMNDRTLANYTEIDINFRGKTFKIGNWIESRVNKVTTFDFVLKSENTMLQFLEGILRNPDVRKLYEPKSNEKFDLLIVETLYWQGVYPLATRFNVPIIGIASLALNLNTLYAIGSPLMPSHPANWEINTQVSDRHSFWQRLKNFVTVWNYVYWYRTSMIAKQEAIARKYFGNDIPSLDDLAKNMSLIFVNHQGPISYAVPNHPKFIEIGGFHLSKETIKLPKDLKRVLDEATEGFIYMSLGSNAKSVMLPTKTKNEFLTAFSKLPYKVLWKFEDDVLPHKPDNVHIMKWVPQQAVLAHPNLKVFVYQGGVQSTEEAVHHAVPLVGLPVLCDQDMQVNKMVSLGVAKSLEITALDGNELFEAIITVATDPSYKQKMLDLRSLINDRPHDLLENAIWWTEYVIRHKGVPHLQSATADEPWYSRQDMDIVAFISTGFLMVFGLITRIAYNLFKLIYNCPRYTGTRSLKIKKIN